MNTIFDTLKPELTFSAENPFFKSMEKTHRMFADAFDRTARMQHAFGEELLDLNKKSFESLYAGNPARETLAAHSDLMVEAGNGAAALVDEFQHVITDFQAGVTDAANEWLSVAIDAVSAVSKAAKKSKTGKTSKSKAA